MTAREFLRRRLALRRKTRFIPIQTFGFDEFEPVHLPPRGSHLLARRDDGDAALAAAAASPSFSVPES